MNCPSCHTSQAGDTCKICSHVFKEKKQPKVLQRSKKPINKVSKKMSSDLRHYSALRKQFLIENPMCKVYPYLKATDIHHKKSRGKYLLDTTTWIAVSRIAHQKIEENPAWAKAQGYSLERLKTTI